MSQRQRVLSGVQPSGPLHIGNYFGAIRQHIALQEAGHECFYFVANYHALTSSPSGEAVAEYTQHVATAYLALGLDPQRSALYRQSDLPEVTELAWILNCVTPMGLLERCVAYKEKIAGGLKPNVGLFDYPVLQAADILIVRPDLVPVGADQKQHIEVTQDIQGKFNQRYGAVLKRPEPYIVEETAVVPGTDGRKMSKTYGNTIDLFAPEKQVRKAIMSVVTDSTPVEAPKDPQRCHVFALLRLFAGEEELSDWERRYREGGTGYGEAKQRVFELFLEHFGEARRRYEALRQRPEEVEAALAEGARRAREVADEVMAAVRRATGLRRVGDARAEAGAGRT